MKWARDRVAGIGWWKALRYSAVSVIGTVITQLLLVAGHGVVGLDATVANVVACSTAAIPVFVLNRAWVWNLGGRASVRREIVPFWSFTLAGLALSTVAVSVVASLTASTLALSAANIGAFGVLWGVKLLVLDSVVFAPAARADDLVPVAS